MLSIVMAFRLLKIYYAILIKIPHNKIRILYVIYVIPFILKIYCIIWMNIVLMVRTIAIYVISQRQIFVYMKSIPIKLTHNYFGVLVAMRLL